MWLNGKIDLTQMILWVHAGKMEYTCSVFVSRTLLLLCCYKFLFSHYAASIFYAVCSLRYQSCHMLLHYILLGCDSLSVALLPLNTHNKHHGRILYTASTLDAKI
jgi:hypothetical protein